MTYTAPEVVTMIAAIGVLVTSIAGAIVTIIVSLRTGRDTRDVSSRVDQQLNETKEMKGQIREVHTQTNSNLSALKAELALAVSRIEGLQATVLDLRSERTALAVSAALMTPVPPRAARVSDGPRNGPRNGPRTGLPSDATTDAKLDAIQEAAEVIEHTTDELRPELRQKGQ